MKPSDVGGNNVPDLILRAFLAIRLILLRYETEYTPCTGITAVAKQERRNFRHGVMIAPWCPQLLRAKLADDPVSSGAVIDTGWGFPLLGSQTCRVLTTADGFMPTVYLSIPGHFAGKESPYDVSDDDLSRDALVFGLAVEGLLDLLGNPGRLLWGADWQSVPALMRLRTRYSTALTLHNTFDRPLELPVLGFGTPYECFQANSHAHAGPKTALEVGIEAVDAVTTVNPGFARGLRTEILHRQVLADHLQHLLGLVVGVRNGPFSTLPPSAVDLLTQLSSDFAVGKRRLAEFRSAALASLPPSLRERVQGKALVVCMGRRVAQKLHEVVVESVRSLLTAEPDLPLFVVFATTHGDESSPIRLSRIQALEAQFPDNVVATDGRLSFYPQLMAAADYNCMSSLYEPHGGAYESTVVPIARAVDGLAEQICALSPAGAAESINRLWHSSSEPPTGFLFREPNSDDPNQPAELRELLLQSSPPSNKVFRSMVMELSSALRRAVALRMDDEDAYARLVMAVLERQTENTWPANLGGVLALVEAARSRRATL